jgi:hypothetical protein
MCAIEAKRFCGFRHVHGLYLVGGLLEAPCDRMPYPIPVCPICGQGIKVSRGFTRINPFKLFGNHEDCHDESQPCIMCQPKDTTSYILGVGDKFYTVKSFLEEARVMGVSKKIPFIPQEFKVGETVIYLAHRKACVKPNSEGEADATGKVKMLQDATGIFCAFVPQRIEKLYYERELLGKQGEKIKKQCERQNINIVVVPDSDEDHPVDRKYKRRRQKRK